MRGFAKSGKKVCERCQQIDFKNTRVCSKHFVQDDYKLQVILLETVENKRRLNDDAVPSQYLRQQGNARQIEKSKAQETKKVVLDAVSSFKRYDIIQFEDEIEKIGKG